MIKPFAMRVALVLTLASAALCQVPPLPFYDWGACPGEYCGYHEWTAHRAVIVYDTWKPRRRRIATIVAGAKATGLRGVVITYTPGRIRMDRDLPEASLKRGEILLTYAFRGEGFSAVSFHNKYYSDFDISFTKWPDGIGGCAGSHCAATYVDLGKKSWWAEVKLASGATGWVDMGSDQGDTALY